MTYFVIVSVGALVVILFLHASKIDKLLRESKEVRSMFRDQAKTLKSQKRLLASMVKVVRTNAEKHGETFIDKRGIDSTVEVMYNDYDFGAVCDTCSEKHLIAKGMGTPAEVMEGIEEFLKGFSKDEVTVKKMIDDLPNKLRRRKVPVKHK